MTPLKKYLPVERSNCPKPQHLTLTLTITPIFIATKHEKQIWQLLKFV